MKFLLATLGAALLLTACSAEPAPQISFDKTNFDFGQVAQFGGKVKTTFTVKNTGDAPLIIQQIATSCSCTEAKIAEKEIVPSGETTLTVIFDPNLHEEPAEKFTRIVFLSTNDPIQPEAQVTIQVDILEGQPSEARLSQ